MLAGLSPRTVKTPEQIRAYQQRLRAEFIRSLGGFPERTPLRPRIAGRLQGDGFRAEKLIYESRPGFHVTAVLYLPEAAPPYPGVLLPCGHSENGKAAELYQRAAILMTRNGLAVLCYDPIGQGERKQILQDGADRWETAKGRFRPTVEHNLAGVAPILLGQNLATYRIWDGIRSAALHPVGRRGAGRPGGSGRGTRVFPASAHRRLPLDAAVAAEPGRRGDRAGLRRLFRPAASVHAPGSRSCCWRARDRCSDSTGPGKRSSGLAASGPGGG